MNCFNHTSDTAVAQCQDCQKGLCTTCSKQYALPICKYCNDYRISNEKKDIYLELFELIGRDAMLKLFKHFRGDKIDCPMRLYRPEFIADLAKQVPDRRERAKIARAGGYSAKVIESILNKRRKENEAE